MCRRSDFAPPPAAISPYDKASWLSRVTYLYALPLFRLGARQPLSADDLPPIAKRDEVPVIAERIEKSWAFERTKPAPSLAKALATCFRADLLLSAVLFLLDYGALVAQAALLRPFVNWLESGGGGLRRVGRGGRGSV